MKESHNYEHSHTHISKNGKNIIITILLNFSFAIIEFIGYLFTGSVSLYSSAIHDLGDVSILLASFFIERFSLKGRSKKYTYGYRRFTLVASIINCTILIIGSFFIFKESLLRLLHPVAIDAKLIVYIAIIGIFINYAGVKLLGKDTSKLNKSLILNLKADIYNFIALLLGSILILFFDVFFIDSLFAILVALKMLVEVYKEIRDIFATLMQSVPQELDVDDIEQIIRLDKRILDVHDIHIWNLDGEDYILTCHIVLADSTKVKEMMKLKEELKLRLEEYKINHATIEVDNYFQAVENGEICSTLYNH